MKNNDLSFDIDDIIELASETSFERGEDYYNEGNVENITRTGNKFQGTVSGLQKYKVTLEIKNEALYFNCNCPYDKGGICKHSVALALAILDDEFSDTSENTVQEQVINPYVFSDCFRDADTEKKLNFLKQLLDKDSDLQKQFIAFTKSNSENLDSIIGINIDLLKDYIYNELSSMDFNEIVENYHSYDDGYYDDEGYIDAAYDEINDVFNPYKLKAIEFIRKGNLSDVIRIMLGLYEGSQNLPELKNDEYEIFDGSYSDTVIDLLTKIFNDIACEIGQIVKSDEIIQQAVNIFIHRFKSFENQNVVIDKDKGICYDLKIFEKFFLSLLINKPTAGYIYKVIQENDLECLNMAFVLLKIAEIIENEKLWLTTAGNYAEFEIEISKQLLEKYKQNNDAKNFNRVAAAAFNKWPQNFDFYLIGNLDKEQQKELYVNALKHYSEHKQSIKYYKELREYFDDNQRKEFIDNISKSFNHVFYVQLLDIEKRFPDILTLVKKLQNTEYDFEKLIAPIINIYPSESFDIIKNKCDLALKSYNRNRKTYHNMANWLRVMVQIESRKTETQRYIKSLFEFKPNLPALKDEIKKAGLL